MKRYSFDTPDLVTAAAIGVIGGILFGTFEFLLTLWESIEREDIQSLAEGSESASGHDTKPDKSLDNGDISPVIIKVKGRQ